MYSDNKIEIIQKKELNILKEFIRVCEKYNLEYFALGGTLLEAVRHEGFIPWDDDIDIGMPRKDYEQFMTIPSSEFNSPYILVNEKNTKGFTKAFMNLRDSNTRIMMTYSNVEVEESLWIDIFPIDGLPKQPIKKYIHERRYLLSRMMVQLSQFNKIVNQRRENRPFVEKLIINLASFTNIEKLLPYEKYQKKYIEIISKYDMTEGYSGNFAGAYKLKELVPTSYFGKGDYLKFEDLCIRVPNNYKAYLSAIYGENYMTLPPLESRVPHQYNIITLGDINE